MKYCKLFVFCFILLVLAGLRVQAQGLSWQEVEPGSYRLYDDDGETFDYEQGHYSWREIQVRPGKNGRLQGRISKALPGKPNTIGRVTWKFMSPQ